MPSQREVADHLFVSPRRVRELLDQGIIRDLRSSPMDQVRESYIRHLREEAAGRKSGVIDLTQERAKLAVEQSRNQALKNAELEGELLRRSDVVETWATMFVAAKGKMRAIPKRALLRIPRFTKKMARKLQEMIDEVLRELAGDGLPRNHRDREREEAGEQRMGAAARHPAKRMARRRVPAK